MAQSTGSGSAASGVNCGQRLRIANSSEAPREAEGDSMPTVNPPRWVSTISGSRLNWV